MRKRKPEAQKKKPGPRPSRTFYNRIGFQIATSFHTEISKLAQERNVRFEDIYAESVKYLIDTRKIDQILYTPSPTRRFAKRVTIQIEPSLDEAVRSISHEDQQRLTDFFQTAAWLYLKHLDRLPEKQSASISQL